MIVEVRSYRITPGKREEFLNVFRSRSIGAMQDLGIRILGPLVDLENPNRFIFLRGFPTMDDLRRMKDQFYGGDVWLKELEHVLMPMLESYDVSLCETAAGFVMDDLREDG